MAIEDFHPFDDAAWLRAQSALVGAGAVAAAAALFGESRGWSSGLRFAMSLAAAIIAGCAVFFGRQLGVFAPPLIAALCLAVPLAPHLFTSNSLRFWTFLHWGAFGAALAFVSVLLFVLGVTAILEMVRYLFDVGIPQRAYEHLYVVACAFVGPLFALGRIPRDLFEEAVIAAPAEDRLSSGLGTLQDWIAAPLALAVALVLHAYAAKIVLTGELPKNQIGWIVGSFALFALTVRVAAHPFLTRGGVATRLFGRIWTATLVLPLLLLAYGLWLRISDQGVTGERYYLGLAAVSAGAIVLAQVFPRLRGDIRLMAAVPVLLLALSAFGPWGVAQTVARSQIDRLLRDYPSLGRDGDKVDALTEERREAARTRLQAIAAVGALPALMPHLGDEDRNAVAGLEEDRQLTVLLDRLGLGYGTPSPQYRSFAGQKPVALDVTGYDTFFTNLGAYASEFSGTVATDAPPQFVTQNGEITLRWQGVTDRFDAAAAVRSLPDVGGASPEAVAPFVADIRTRDGRSLRLFVRSASFDPATLGGVSLSFDLALRRAEWPASASLGGGGQR
ncbi:DUF4153 domain-containing protein [Aureimonas leprariae]|uniref:DUF4153 domain-containing protein n=1 Tax=Plantimonas leprariae TaxID=2615207 RepID=A0A7V7PS87_9HYPH|nr:DUF4153 domain-containing protein [Aureimonas leprariae]KAB0681973.1 DUF4153 domain-containing protein [Aureimonas leprariae]